MTVSRRPVRLRRAGVRPVMAALAATALLSAWVAVPGPGGERIIAAVAPDGAEPLPVASGYVAGSAESGQGTVAVAAAGAGDMPATDRSVAVPPVDPPVAVPPVAVPPVAVPPVDPAAVPRQGPGTYQLAAGGTGVVGTGDDLVTYSVEVESGLPFDPAVVAARVDAILGDSRSWIGLGRWRLQRVEDGGDARIVVASPGTVDNLCYPLQTAGTYSCRNGPFVVLNADRWALGAQSWGTDVEGYRGYLVNHEFGHFLGFSHTPCPAAGAPAPVMLQQTKGLGGCAANAWPTLTDG